MFGIGDCAAVSADCRLVEFEAEDVVESSMRSITVHVCRVASGANETRLSASDLGRAALCSMMAFLRACRRCSSSSAECWFCSASSFESGRAIGLKTSTMFSVPGFKVPDPGSRLGAGVEKSMSRSSGPSFAGDFAFPVLFLRNVSNEGITFGGVSGTAGFSMDFGWKIGGIYGSQ